MNHFKRDMIALILFFVLLFIGWVVTGGPEQAYQSGSYDDKFQRPIAPLDSGSTYDESIKELSPIKIKRLNESGTGY